MAAKNVISLIVCLVASVHGSFFEVRYPSVAVTAETGGNLSVVAGPNGGNIYMTPGANGTVYIGHTDMLKLFKIVNSMPPVWGQKAPYGSLGTFFGTDSISITLTAIDPEGSPLRFEKISGALPPNVVLDPKTGRLTGTAPDVDATYEFGIRVIDEHGKYADQTFTIDTRERNQCKSNPCQHGGTCVDDIGTFKCSCQSRYGGKTCNIVCENQAVGVAQSVKKIPDAQMSGHYAYSSSDHKAYEARLGNSGGNGWIGESTSSWLQIDLGDEKIVHAVATQGMSSSYTLSTYALTYSLDGNSFSYVTNGTSQMTFSGSGSSYSSTTKQVLPVPVKCRYIRFRPKTWTSSHPGMRVEVYACDV